MDANWKFFLGFISNNYISAEKNNFYLHLICLWMEWSQIEWIDSKDKMSVLENSY